MTTSTLNPVLQCAAQVKDSNSRGDMFGGWLMGQMDLAGVVPIIREFDNDFVTAAVNTMQFLKPLLVNAWLSIEAEIIRVGTSSVTVGLTAYATYKHEPFEHQKVATAELVYVAICKLGKPTALVHRKK